MRWNKCILLNNITQTNKPTNKQTNNQINKKSNKQINKPTNKQRTIRAIAAYASQDCNREAWVYQ